MSRKRILYSHSVPAAALLSAALAVVPAYAITTDELAQKLEALEAQNIALQTKVEKLEAALHLQADVEKKSALTVEQAQQSVNAKANAARNSSTSTSVGAYGEIGYSRPSKAPEKAYADVGRAVILLEHRFDESTKMDAEFEWEHAITSSTDKGEAEIEQLYVEHEFKNGLRGVVGLYLMPAGLINQNHEPTAYYGVWRPDVDTKIIPSTWREVGLGLSGSSDTGISWDMGITTTQNLSKWDAASDEALVRGPLQSIHGEGQFASARNLAVHAAVNWRTPGTLLGASVFTGKIGQQQPDFLGNNSRLLLWEMHGRYELAGWDFAGEYARGTISNTEFLNLSFAASSTPHPTLVPSRFFGGYVQAAYRLWAGRYYRLTPFARYEIYNTAADYGPLSIAQSGVMQPDEKLWTLGVSFFFGEGVVLKADYRHYSDSQLPSAVPPGFGKGNSLNIGMGFSF